MGGLFTIPQWVSEVIWWMEESVVSRDFTANNMFSNTRWPETSAVTSLSVLSDLSVHLCLLLTFVSFVLSPLSDDRRLAQMTKLTSFVKPSRASFTGIVNRGRACQCAAHGRILHGPQGSLDHTSAPLPPGPQSFVFGLQGGPQRRRRVPNLLVPPIMRFIGTIAAFSEIWWENWMGW